MPFTDLPLSFKIYFGVLAFIFGACMGSFLNCAAYRMVRGESFIKGRSHCTSCGHELGMRDLFPIISWITLRGRCRYCGAKLSKRYVLTETAFGIITVICLAAFGFTVLGLRNYIFICILFVLTLTDIDDMIIPDGCHIAAVITWIAAEPFLFDGWGRVISHIAAALVFGGAILGISLAMDKALGRDSMGGGDIKLIAVCGLYLGFIGTLFAVMIACVCGLVFNVIVRGHSNGGKTLDAYAAGAAGSPDSPDDAKTGSTPAGSPAAESAETDGAITESTASDGLKAAAAGDDNGDGDEEDPSAFPFGPWIAAGAAVMLIAGEPLINWYSSLLG